MSMTSGVMAQTGAEAAAEESGALEEVVVTGIRGGLANAVATKRNSDAVVDAVSAEDIGKFPDSDVAEALARVPGISVNRQFGQGQQVSIRGASNQLTLTTLNGQNVASTGWYDQQAIDRSFNYSLLPPEMIAGMDVYKSSQADLVEGGIGGTINVKTRKPLDLDANTVFLSAEATYGTISEETDPAVSGLYSWKNDAETFGILAGYSRNDTNYIRRGNEAYTAWNDSVSVNSFEQEREQQAFDLAAQWRPTDRIQLGAHYINLDMKADNTNNSLFIFRSADPANCDQVNAGGQCVLETTDAANPNANPAWAQTFARKASMTSETFDFDFAYEGDSFLATARAGHTKAEGGTDSTANYGGLIGDVSQVYGTYDSTGDQIKMDLANPNYTANDFVDPGLASAGWAATKGPNSDEETYFQADVEFDVEFGPVSAIKTGLRWSDHEVVAEKQNGVFDNAVVAADPNYLFSGTSKAGMDDFEIPAGDLSAMINDTENQARYVDNRQAYGTVEEENLAAYVMATFEMDRIRGNFGVRYVTTDVSSDYYGTDVNYVDPDGINTGRSFDKSTDSASYSEFLPSFNIAYDLTEDTILRGSVAQVMARPNYDDLFARENLSNLGNTDEDADGNYTAIRSAQLGDVALDPFKANQADLAIEWYYGSGNLMSATLFYKDITNFTTYTITDDVAIGVTDPVTGLDSWNVTQKVNGDGGTIAGLELQIQHAFDNGFGVLANYTYADSNVDKENFVDEVGVFSDSSENTVNLVGYYEMNDFSARAAYNWRSEYMIRESGFYGNRMHDDFGTLDLSFGYQVTENIGITFDAVNVLEEDSVQTGVSPNSAAVEPEFKNNYPTWTYQGEAYYTMGVNARF
ncbi:TonB-dependent receptor [Sinobacterium norvegicum]|nr:TonB-dependent receptor [Sinobacterium norvegicum]